MTTGVWIDTDTGDMTARQPVHGRVVVPVGDEIPQAVAELLAARKKSPAKKPATEG